MSKVFVELLEEIIIPEKWNRRLVNTVFKKKEINENYRKLKNYRRVTLNTAKYMQTSRMKG